MPGIYVSDGGGLSSALSSALAGIATNMSPEAQAKAEALRYSTEGQDIANQKAAEALQALQNSTNQSGRLLGQAGAQPGGVAGAVAGMAQPPALPPLVGNMRHPAGTVLSTDPLTAQFQNWVQTGQATPDAVRNSIIPLGQTMVGGAGSDYGTQGDLYKQRHAPRSVAAGETVYTDPMNPSAPVLHGSDPATVTAEGQQRTADVTDANSQAKLGQTAAQQINENDRLMQIYNTLVNSGGDDTAGIVGDQAFKDLAKIPGLEDATKLSSRLGAIDAIRARLAASINNQLQAVQAGSPVRGLLQTIHVPDPGNLDPEQFRAAMEQYKRVLQYQKDEGDIAEQFRGSAKDKAAADAYRAAVKAHSDQVFKEQQGDIAAGAKPPATPTAPAAPDTGPPPAAVDHLRAHPELAPAFDTKYGAGSARKVLGR